MAVVLVLNDIVEATIACGLNEQVSLNKVHFRVSAVVNAPTDQNAALAVDNALGTVMKASMSQDALYRGVGIQRVAPGPRTGLVFNIGNTGIGLIALNALPRQDSIVISARTALAGRAFRGRFYFPFLPVNSSGPGGIPTAPFQVGMTNVANALQGPIPFGLLPNIGTLVPCVFHAKAKTSTDITAWLQLRNAFGTQRRRGTYGRPNILPF